MKTISRIIERLSMLDKHMQDGDFADAMITMATINLNLRVINKRVTTLAEDYLKLKQPITAQKFKEQLWAFFYYSKHRESIYLIFDRYGVTLTDKEDLSIHTKYDKDLNDPELKERVLEEVHKFEDVFAGYDEGQLISIYKALLMLEERNHES